MIEHISPPTHEREVPSRLTGVDAAFAAPILLHIVMPVVFINITSLGHLHAVQAQSSEIVQDILSNLRYTARVYLGDTQSIDLWWHLAREFDEA